MPGKGMVIRQHLCIVFKFPIMSLNKTETPVNDVDLPDKNGLLLEYCPLCLITLTFKAIQK